MSARPTVFSSLLVAVLCALPCATAAADSASRVIVQWRGAGSEIAATPARIENLRNRSGQRVARGWNIGGRLSVVQLDQTLSGESLARTLAALRAHPDVEFAVPDERVRAYAYTPSDQLYPSQWYLQGTQIAAIRANQAWDITRGNSAVIVAVLDTGVRFDHPDLAGKLLPGWDFIADPKVANDGGGWDSDASDEGDFMTAQDLADPVFAGNKCGGGVNFDQPTASSWHGTRVAGLIAAASDNGIGFAGTGFHVRVLPVRVLGKCGGMLGDVIAGMYWAAGLAPPPPYLSTPLPPVNNQPAKIINMSLGSDTPCSGPYSTAVRDLTDRGVLIVASAGNSGKAVGTPASCAGALAVAGIRHAGTKVGYSNLGLQVGIAAPAGNCVNVAPGSPCLFALHTTTNFGQTVPTTNGYSSQTTQITVGTSFSTPLVSGTAALMLSANPTLTPPQIIQLIRSSARVFPASSDGAAQPQGCPAQVQPCVSPDVQSVQSCECICTTQVCGAGMLDAHAAVLAAQGSPPPPPPPSDPGGGGGGNAASLLWLLMLLGYARRPALRPQPSRRP